MTIELTDGFVKAALTDALQTDARFQQPLVQVLSLKKSSVSQPAGNNPETSTVSTDRWRLTISDGQHFTIAMLATQLNNLAEGNLLNKGAVIRLNHYVCNAVNGRKIIIILHCDPVQPGVEQAKIGNPVALDQSNATKSAPMPAHAPQSMPPQRAPTMNHQPMNNTMNQPPSSMGSFRPMNNAPMKNAPMSNMPPSNRMGGMMGMPSSAPAFQQQDNGMTVFPIKSLSPYQNKWTIKARVIQKTDIKTWKNARGEGRLYSFTLKDESGEIRATAFNDGVTATFDLIKENQVYYISKAQVKVVRNRQYSNVDNEYELNVDSNTTICADAKDVPGLEYAAVPLNNLMNYDKDATIDIVAVVSEASDVQRAISKNQKEYVKRELTLCDQTEYQVRLTLFGNHAENYKDHDHPVVAIKGAKVSDYGGRTLSLLNNSTMAINPDIAQAYAVRGWYDANVRNNSNFVFKKYSSMGDGDGSGRTEVYKKISQIKDENLGAREKPDYFSIRGTIAFVKTENIAYTACPTEGCNKKVTMEHDDAWRCEKCDRSFPAPVYSALDHTGQTWMNVFNEMGLKLLCKSADEMMKLKDINETAYTDALQSINFKPFTFKVRAKQENWNDEVKIRLNVLDVQPIDYSAECVRLCDMIEEYL